MDGLLTFNTSLKSEVEVERLLDIKMRFKIKFSFRNTLELPIQYNHIVQALIYDSIPDKDFRAWLHDQGMSVGKRSFKMFTFSRLFGRFEVNPKGGVVKFLDNVTLYVSSAVNQVVQELGNGLLARPVRLLNQQVEVEEVRVLAEPTFGRNTTIRMLSPVVIYRTENREKPFTRYYGPSEPEFRQLLVDNLFRKYKALFEKAPEDDSFSIETNSAANPTNQKIMKYKGTVIKGWMGSYRLCGNPELLKLAYDCGLGSKNAQGFGCFEVVEGGDHGPE